METLRRNWQMIAGAIAIAAIWGSTQTTLSFHQRQIDKLEQRLQNLDRIPVMEQKLDGIKEAFEEHKKNTQKP